MSADLDDLEDAPLTWPRAFVIVMTHPTFWLGVFWAFVGASCCLGVRT